MIITPWSHGGHVRKFKVHLSAMAPTPEFARAVATITRSDVDDVKKVVKIVLQNKLLVQMENREHRSFNGMKLNPLHKWDITKTKQWIQKKIKEYQKYQANFCSDVSESDIEGDLADIEGDLGDIEGGLGDIEGYLTS